MKSFITNVKTVIVSLVLFAAVPVAFAWNVAPPNPPFDNVAAPVNVSDGDQSKQGKLGLGGLAIFGKLQLIDGTQGAGKVLVSDANGKASWAAMSGVGSGTTLSGGSPVVCGGWDVKYGTSNPINGWGCGESAACPAGYDTIKSSKVTINLAEQTNLCVLSRAGGSTGGGGGTQIYPGWPNKILCEAPDGSDSMVMYVWGGNPKTAMSYINWSRDPQMSLQFNASTGEPQAVSPTTSNSLGKYCVKNIKDLKGFN